jgi:hypothetical protein
VFTPTFDDVGLKLTVSQRHRVKTAVVKPLHRGPGVNLMCKLPLGVIKRVCMIHRMRITLAPLMTSHGHGATRVLVVWIRAGHTTDNLTSRALQRTCYNLQPALKTRWVVIGLSNDHSRWWIVNSNATGVTAVQVDRAIVLRMTLWTSMCVKFDLSLADRGALQKLLPHINLALRHDVELIGCEMVSNKHRRHLHLHLRLCEYMSRYKTALSRGRARWRSQACLATVWR